MRMTLLFCPVRLILFLCSETMLSFSASLLREILLICIPIPMRKLVPCCPFFIIAYGIKLVLSSSSSMILLYSSWSIFLHSSRCLLLILSCLADSVLTWPLSCHSLPSGFLLEFQLNIEERISPPAPARYDLLSLGSNASDFLVLVIPPEHSQPQLRWHTNKRST